MNTSPKEYFSGLKTILIIFHAYKLHVWKSSKFLKKELYLYLTTFQEK